MGKQVCVLKEHRGKRRDSRTTRLMIDEDEYEAELADAEKEGRYPIYALEGDGQPGGNSFDKLSKAEQKEETQAQKDRAKLKEIDDAEAAE